MKALLFLAAFLCFTGQALAQVAELKFREANPQDLCDVLEVRTFAGSFLLREPCGEIRIVVEGFVQDKLVFSASSGSVVAKDGAINFPPGVCEFRVSIVDLDVIRLRGSKPGNCRIIVGYRVPGASGSTAPTDVPKAKLDLSGTFNFNPRLDSRGASTLELEPGGRTLLFSLSGGGGLVQKMGPDGNPSFSVLPDTQTLKCYFERK